MKFQISCSYVRGYNITENKNNVYKRHEIESPSGSPQAFLKMQIGESYRIVIGDTFTCPLNINFFLIFYYDIFKNKAHSIGLQKAI